MRPQSARQRRNPWPAHADVERLLASPLLSPKVSVSGHVYDIATGRVTSVVDARHPQLAGNN